MPRERQAAPASKKGGGKKIPAKLTTPTFVGSFVHLDQPYSGSEDIDPCYSILIVLDPEDREHAKFIETMEDLIDDLIKEKWGETPRKFTSPIRNGEDIGDSDELQGKICINVRSDRRPGIVDANLQRIIDVEEECYSGASYVATIVGYAWTHKVGGNGVSFGLNNVMKVDEGEPLGGGRASPEDDFADYAGAKNNSRGGVQRTRTRGKVVDNDEDQQEQTPRRRRR